MKPKLAEVLASLVHREESHYIRLKRGLVLAYTPGPQNSQEPGQYKLCLSRKGGTKPSQREDGLVHQALLSALKGRGRQPQDVILQPNVVTETANGRRVEVTYIIWREAEQEGFPF